MWWYPHNRRMHFSKGEILSKKILRQTPIFKLFIKSPLHTIEGYSIVKLWR
ncbi:hypothetical protein DF16_pBMB293orf00262 (plasmid) [Bacillus thuringiensis serovar kurstaki str. YBT-1520]|nr:hypothetical protein DF16_pBMB293orf00262 [Bacillus thuringiensis serovar kurstaki str. YBT-1520]